MVSLGHVREPTSCDGAEWVNGGLKDDFGGRYVRGHAKVLCHLIFGILALTCDQLLRLIV
jgi:hypothetical protein